MTFRQHFVNYLVERGMFDKDAEEVMFNVEAVHHDTIGVRLDDEMEGYPPQLAPVVALVVEGEALAWIDENVPQAWYRPMFEPRQPKSASQMLRPELDHAK